MLSLHYGQYLYASFKTDADRDTWFKKFRDEQQPGDLGRFEVRVNPLTNKTEFILPIVFKDKKLSNTYGVSVTKRYIVEGEEAEANAKAFAEALTNAKEESKSVNLKMEVLECYDLPEVGNQLQIDVFETLKKEKDGTTKEGIRASLRLTIPPRVV